MKLSALRQKLLAHGDRCIEYYEGAAVRSRTFADLAKDSERIAAVLRLRGIDKGMCVGIMAHNCYEWVVYDLALLELGAICVALPMEHFERADREPLAARYGMRLLLLGPDAADLSPGPWVQRMALEEVPRLTLRDPGSDVPQLEDDVLTLAFSSGTSGQVKCLIFSREGTEAVVASFGRDFRFWPQDRLLAFLPLASIQQRWMLWTAIEYGFGLCLTVPSRLFHALRDLRPTIICSAPLLFETIESAYITRTGPLKWLLEALRHCLAVLPLPLRIALGRRVFRPIHGALGGHVRFCVVGAAASRLTTLKFYDSIGMPLYQGWGMTETGFQSWNLPGRNRLGSVGQPLHRGAIEICADGEILVRHRPLPTLGYLDVAEEEMRRTFIEPHCIATGDIGHFDDEGYLFIEGRKKEIIISRGGYKIQPSDLEREILMNERVAHAVVVGGDDLHCVMAVVAVRGRRDPHAEASVSATIEALNRRLPAQSRIGRVAFADQPFTRENRLLNRNLKVDRKVVLERFKEQLLA